MRGYGNPYVLIPVLLRFPVVVVVVVPVGISSLYCLSLHVFRLYKKREEDKCPECPSDAGRNVLRYITTGPLLGAYATYGVFWDLCGEEDFLWLVILLYHIPPLLSIPQHYVVY